MQAGFQLFTARDHQFPLSFRDIPAWRDRQTPVEKVKFTGGSYWLVAQVRNLTSDSAWVFNPYGSLMEHVDVRVYRPGQPVQTFQTGYRAKHAYMLHYGLDLTLRPGERTWVVAQIRSPYFASQPNFSFEPQDRYRQQVNLDNLLTLVAFGALLALSCYNLFIFAGTHNRSFFYYAAYALTYCVAWAFTFHVPADVFGFYDLRWHYVGFFLLPVLNTLFYLHFLKLDQRLPLLGRLSRVNLWLPLALLPSSFLLLPYTHILATGVVSLWLVLALVCGVASWRQGFYSARFFVFGLLALMVPATMILPANVGLMPDPVRNTELLTLLGGTLDGLLLAFALADQLRLLMRDNISHIVQLRRALHLAGTDTLTGLHNRHAFGQAVGTLEDHPFLLVLMDLDGLKTLNDTQGHARGDDLLRVFARLLQDMESEHITAYRLGGDEFALIAPPGADAALVSQLQTAEETLRAGGFPTSGLSVGMAHAGGGRSAGQVFEEADQRMYRHKQAKKGGKEPSDRR